jgi:hypothetical protein
MRPPTPESQLSHDIRLALGRESDLVLWRNHVGSAQVRGVWQRFGLAPGSADLVGVGPGGRFFALEIKAPSGREREDQTLWANLVRSKGGFVATVRSVAEARAALEEARVTSCLR